MVTEMAELKQQLNNTEQGNLILICKIETYLFYVQGVQKLPFRKMAIEA